MILPTVAAISQDALHQIPYKVKEAAYGMGTTRWEAILKVLLPTASGGIFSGLVLGFGRALGETMALAMLIGNANQISLSLFAPANTLASLMASNFPEAGGTERDALMYRGPRAAGGDPRREHHRLLAARPDPETGSELTMAASSLPAGVRPAAASTGPNRAPRRPEPAPDARRVARRAHRERPAVLRALHADHARWRPAEHGPVHPAAARRLHDGRRLRQRGGRHAGDGRASRR